MTSVAVWGSKQHNSEGTIRGKRHSWLRGFPKTGYYGEHPLQGARCWCWWWSWWWWWSLWWSWRWCCSWYDGRFGLWVYNNEEVQLFYLYYCIFRKRMRNLYPMKKYWCQVQVSWLRLPRPSAPPTSLPELLTVTLLMYKGCAENQCNCIFPPFWWNRRWWRLSTQVGEATYSQSSHISSSFLYPNNWRLALAQLKPQDGGLEESRSLQLRSLLDGWSDHLQVRTSVNLLPILPWPWCFSFVLFF